MRSLQPLARPSGDRLMRSVKVNRKAADRVASGHPWIFASDIVDRGGAEPGEAVQVIDFRNRALGTAHYSASSQITLRLLSNQVEEIDESFLRKRLTARDRIPASSRYRIGRLSRRVFGRRSAARADRRPLWRLPVDADPQSGNGSHAAGDRSLSGGLLAPKGIIARNDVAVRTREELPIETKIVSGEVHRGLTWR